MGHDSDLRDLRLLVIDASGGVGTLGHPIAQEVWRLVRAEISPSSEYLGLPDLGLPLLSVDLGVAGGEGGPSVDYLKGALDRQAAVLVVTPDINGGYPAMLKNALDVAADRLSGKALGVVAVQVRPGPQGVVAQLLTVGVTLGMRPAQHHVVIDDPRHHVDTLADAPRLSTQADLNRLVSELA